MTPMMSHNTNPRHGMPICDKVNKYKQMIYRNKVYKGNKLLCPRGTQTCALAVANIKVNGNGKVILDTHPESDQHQN